MALAEGVGDVFTHSHGFPPWLCFSECLLLSTPKCKVHMGPQGEIHNFCSIWRPCRQTPVLPSPHCGPCQQSLPCRPHRHTGVLQTSGCTRDTRDALFTTVYPHYIASVSCFSVQLQLSPGPVCGFIPSFCFSFPEVDPFELLKPDDLQSIVCETIRSAVQRFRFSASKRRLLCWATEVSLT